MRTRADVVIIGGGIQGTSVAYHLAKRGGRDIVLVEVDMVGSGSSGRSAAMILLQESRDQTVRMSQESFKEYLNFQDEFGVDIGYKPIGYLTVATGDVADELRAEVELQKQLGVPTETLSPADIARLVPSVNIEDIVFGAVCWQDGVIDPHSVMQADPHSVMQAYVQHARRLGAEINEKVEATGIVVEKGRVVAVETTAGRILTPVVVNAAGARAAQVGAWVGLRLPVANYKRSIFVTDRFDAIPDDSPFVMDLAAEWYFRKEGKGVLMGMGREESTTFEPQLEWEFLDAIVERAMHRAPILANARVMRGWAGLRSLTPDDYPILGPVAGVAGFVNACGWGGHGVMHAPIGGLLVAEWIAEGKTTTMDMGPFLFERFAASAG
ncbi:MAG: FAD-binding oxidoreductase [Chloroflexi bacterium]|nr:FAD-binding oxidoreductase [Chloroflexota bacterium]